MMPVSHAAASGIVSAVFAYLTHSVVGTIVCFLSGIFIDLDHLIDFWIAKKKIIIDYPKLVSFTGLERGGKLFLVLHSFEFWLLFWVVIVYYQLNEVWVGLAVGGSAHLIIDQLANPTKPLSLSLLYRWKHRFAKECIFRDDYYQEMT
jgi:hypothetical protein